MKQLILVALLLLPNIVLAKDKFDIGGRLQGVMAQDSATETQDMYLRRTRLNVSYTPWKKHKIVYDIRNDSSNKKDKSDGKFQIGDAYWQYEINNYSIKNMRLFRAKVDVSFSQTASSKNLFSPNRTEVSEYASDYVVSNRRANNIQLNGVFNRLAYQVVISDGVDSEQMDVLDGSSRTIKSVEGQKLTYGAKVRYYFMGDARKNKLKETYYGKKKILSLGLGKFNNDKIILKLSDDSLFITQRSLTNVDFSLAYNSFRFLAEYFQFENDIVNLDATTKDKIVDDSTGHYAQVEYLFGKWAPNYGIETFDQSHNDSTYKLTANTIGLNYYYDDVNMRFGMFYKQTTVEYGNNKETSEALQLYTMLHF